MTGADNSALAGLRNQADRPPGRDPARETNSARAGTDGRIREAAMRGMTLAVIGVAAAVLLAIAVFMRSGDDGAATSARDVGTAPRPRLGAAGSANSGGSDSRSSRVEDRLGQLRADYEKRDATDKKPVAGQREVPTVSAKAAKMRENAEKALAADDDGDDPDDVAEARDTLHNNQDPDERIGAIMLLTGNEGPESMQLLMETLDDPDPEVRLAAVEALGDRDEELSPGLLVKPLRDPDAEVRFEAVSVLGDMEDPDALALVKQAENDPDEDVSALAKGILEFEEDDNTNTANAASQQPAKK
ncbi:MAG: HEAT repeat domain-containing protein [Candidatus Binatia bacterium]